VRRIEERDPALNAVVLLATDRAEARVAAGLPQGPLTGLPYLVKDLHADVDGLPLSRGSRLFADLPTAGTSELVCRLEAAGAVVIGRTNTPELGLSITTEPVLHGPTRNPYDLERSPGGSSGGAAAAVAAGMVPAAHATDSGGSTRIPAAWCGLVGFKPTRGVNPTGPRRATDWSGLSHEHAVTRTVADCVRLLQVTAGPLSGDAWHVTPPRDIGAPLRRRLTVGLVTHAPTVPVDPACRAAADAAATTLAELGHDVRPASLPAVAAELGPVLADVIAGHLAAACADLEAHTGRRASADTLEPAVLELAERGRRASAVDFVLAVERLSRMQGGLAACVDEVDVVLTPTTALPAPRLGVVRTDGTAAELFRQIIAHAPFTGLFNVTGGPAISLPWGTDEGGVPLGVQLAGAPGQDAVVMGLASELEAARPSRFTPPAPRCA
jgi:amidase